MQTTVVLFSTVILLLESEAALLADGPPKAPSFEGDVAPFLAKHCTGCHGPEKKKADLALDVYTDSSSALKDQQVWEKVSKKLRAREMPPKGRPQPQVADVEAVLFWIDSAIFHLSPERKDPGRVTLRRLNRAEYDNTVRDLLGVDFKPAEDFPADEVGYGFDNIGDVLSLPPMLMDHYLVAAEKIAEEVIVTGKPSGGELPEAHRRIVICEPTESTQKDCARQILERLAARAYRRPAAPEEVDRLVSFVLVALQSGDSFEKGIQLALEAILVSPHFLFRVEVDPEPFRSDASHPLGDFELASRLSYFLWSSMPDDALFEAARRGDLRKAEVLEAEARRMLKDPKSKALVENFAGQWLGTRKLKMVSPDPGRFPAFDEELRSAMARETELFFEAVLKEDRSVLDFIDADFTFLNEKLARHYGISGVEGKELRRVTFNASSERGGVLTSGTVLTITSNPTRTSPVKRGKWVLEQILGAPPPPPPAGVKELSEEESAVSSGTLRERMEKHRADPNCATCHARMDPIGFAFENFDAVGGWRDRDGQFPIDPSGLLPEGESFSGVKGLKAILKGRKAEFCRALTEKMLTYALGRGMEPYDRPAVDRIVRALLAGGARFSTLILEIVKSDPFQMRRGERGTTS